MLILLIIFIGSLAVTFFIPFRHVPSLRRAEITGEQMQAQGTQSIVRSRIVGTLERIEKWYHHQATDQMLKMLDWCLKIFERTAGRIAGHLKSRRVLVQERFKVIPRESMYWKQIQTWKKDAPTSVVAKQAVAVEIEGSDEDISNHIYI